MYTESNLGEQKALAAVDWTTGCLWRMISVCWEMRVLPKLPAAFLPLGRKPNKTNGAESHLGQTGRKTVWQYSENMKFTHSCLPPELKSCCAVAGGIKVFQAKVLVASLLFSKVNEFHTWSKVLCHATLGSFHTHFLRKPVPDNQQFNKYNLLILQESGVTLDCKMVQYHHYQQLCFCDCNYI